MFVCVKRCVLSLRYGEVVVVFGVCGAGVDDAMCVIFEVACRYVLYAVIFQVWAEMFMVAKVRGPLV